jgi:hypothetical protein
VGEGKRKRKGLRKETGPRGEEGKWAAEREGGPRGKEKKGGCTWAAGPKSYFPISWFLFFLSNQLKSI